MNIYDFRIGLKWNIDCFYIKTDTFKSMRIIQTEKPQIITLKADDIGKEERPEWDGHRHSFTLKHSAVAIDLLFVRYSYRILLLFLFALVSFPSNSVATYVYYNKSFSLFHLVCRLWRARCVFGPVCINLFIVTWNKEKSSLHLVFIN